MSVDALIVVVFVLLVVAFWIWVVNKAGGKWPDDPSSGAL